MKNRCFFGLSKELIDRFEPGKFYDWGTIDSNLLVVFPGQWRKLANESRCCVGLTTHQRKTENVMKNSRKPRIKPPTDDDPPRKRFKDHDLRICTWNVRTLYRDGASIQLVDALKKYKADITAIQEMRWMGQGSKEKGSCKIYYSCHVSKHEFGVGFVVGERLRDSVLQFTPVNERLAALRIKGKFFNISLICAHAPTEEKDDLTKEEFYERLNEVYERCPHHDVKIVLGDFNAKVGKEPIFGQTIGKYSLHAQTSDNGMRLIDFAAANNMVVSSTRFPHLDIHKATWLSPDQRTRNQIDHVVIDGRHASSVLDVRTIRGANIDSDHFLVAAKVRMRLSVANNVRNATQRKLDVEKLQSQRTADTFAARLSHLLSQSTQPDDISAQWDHISRSMRTAAEEVIGFHRHRRNQWYDQECRDATAIKNLAYRATLQSIVTRTVKERYRELRREERRLFKRKKREAEKRVCEEMEMHMDRNEARKFFQKIKRLSDGFKTGAKSCKDAHGNMVTDAQGILKAWREHFSKLLNGDDDINPAAGVENPLTDDGVEIAPPDYDEVVTAIARLKNNKAAGADGLPAELFKTGGEELTTRMHELLCRIWSEESMPSEWSLSVLCPIHKKGDPAVCSNYRGISLLNIAYKVLSSVLCERLKPTVNKLIGPYQCGFRPGKSTIDQIFTLRQILEKTQEKQIDTHHLFVDYKAAFDSTIREHLYAAMSEFGIPAKLIRLCKMTLTDTSSAVLIGKDLTPPFDTKRGFRQGDSLSCDFFNLMLEKIIRASGVEIAGTIFYKSVMLLAYADDIDIIGINQRDVTAAFSSLEGESRRVGLAVNEGKTKYFVSTTKESRRRGQQVAIDNYNFEVVKDFVYLGTSINNTNDVSLEIKRRITLANRCYFGLSRQLRCRALSRRTKITLYKSLIMPVLLYGSEAWTMSKADEGLIGAFERKILRKIYGPICVSGEYRIRWNHELYELFADMDIVKRVKIQRMRWLGHVARMHEDAKAKKVFRSDPSGGRRRRGRPHLRWKDQVLDNLTALGSSNWYQRAQSRGDWRSFLDSAKTDNRL